MKLFDKEYFLQKKLKLKKINFNELKLLITNTHKIPKIIHSIINWNKPNFLHTPKILRKFTKDNIKILKNIFLKSCNDIKMWSEIDKMYVAGLLNFSDKCIYENAFFLDTSIMSVFLMEIYFSELDLFFFKISSQFNSLKNISYFQSSKKIQTQHTSFSPIFSEKSLENANILHNINLKKNLNKKKNISNTLNFCRRIYYNRYKDKFLIGLKGSNSFSLLLKNKMNYFFRSNLGMNLTDTSSTYSQGSSIYFLGYKIKKANNTEKIINKSRGENKNYLKSNLLSKIESIKNKFTRDFLKRFNCELNLFFTRNFSIKNTSLTKLKDKKVWSLVFQFHAIQGVQFWTIFDRMKGEHLNLIPPSHITRIKLIDIYSYRFYSFEIYTYKSRLIVGNILNYFEFPIMNSYRTIDLTIGRKLIELKKNIFFLYSSLYICKESKIELGELRQTTYHKIKQVKIHLTLEITAPINYIYYKLRNLGFIHRNKSRPISNSRYIFLSDTEIIKSIGLLAYSMVLWYHYCSNYMNIKTIIDLLRQSCFLTLCRKHNKSKDWAYKIFTSELLTIKGLFNNYSFFPSNTYIIRGKKSVKTENCSFYINEILFINM